MLEFPTNGHVPPADPPAKASIFDDPGLDPEQQLQHVLSAQRRAYDEWDECQRLADDIDPVDDPDGLENARRNVRNAYRRWFEISGQVTTLGEGLRRKQLELPTSPEWQRAHADLLDALLSQFDGGPHYRLLCERVAGLHVRLKQMETSGRSFGANEHHSLNAQLLTYVNQLQKYTESMKSENISRESQAVAEAILQLVEKHIAASQPEVWHAIMHDVRAVLEVARAAA